MSVEVEKSSNRWNVRLWNGDMGCVVWTFKDELSARQLAMNLMEALRIGAKP